VSSVLSVDRRAQWWIKDLVRSDQAGEGSFLPLFSSPFPSHPLSLFTFSSPSFPLTYPLPSHLFPFHLLCPSSLLFASKRLQIHQLRGLGELSSQVGVGVDHKRSSGRNRISVTFLVQKMCPMAIIHGRHSFLEGGRVWPTFSFMARLIVSYYFRYYGCWSVVICLADVVEQFVLFASRRFQKVRILAFDAL